MYCPTCNSCYQLHLIFACLSCLPCCYHWTLWLQWILMVCILDIDMFYYLLNIKIENTIHCFKKKLYWIAFKVLKWKHEYIILLYWQQALIVCFLYTLKRCLHFIYFNEYIYKNFFLPSTSPRLYKRITQSLKTHLWLFFHFLIQFEPTHAT